MNTSFELNCGWFSPHPYGENTAPDEYHVKLISPILTDQKDINIVQSIIHDTNIIVSTAITGKGNPAEIINSFTTSTSRKYQLFRCAIGVRPLK